MLVYKFDVLEALNEAGYSSYRLRKEKVLSESTVTKLRNNQMIAPNTLDTICRLLDMQPGNIIKYVED